MQHKSTSHDHGLNERIVREISACKNEPAWMLERRLEGLAHFHAMALPTWGPDLSALDPNDICYYLKPVEQKAHRWEDVPSDIKATFEQLGVPEAEKKYLAGLSAQYESEVVYHNLKDEWRAQGVIFTDTETGLREHPELFKKFFGSVVAVDDNKFAALNTALWSGGSFIYIPAGVHVTIPLQAYFRINAEKMGQFERTLIIADEGSLVTYVEGCTAPAYASHALHSAVVEIIAHQKARVRYYTIQNWSKNVYNLVTKRAIAHECAVVEWIDGNFGSKVTMKYPAVILQGQGARADILSIALAGSQEQIQDAGSKVIHRAAHTSSRIISKSISSRGGRTSYRGLVAIGREAVHAKSYVQCNALILDKSSRADAYPSIDVKQHQVDVGHEATVSKLDDERLFYLMSRGFAIPAARTLIVNGFIEPFVKQLPMEFAVEMNRLIELEMEDSVG
ncbi:MAG: Fe-S cluster assembly protein SufB [Candidatus Babeliales bacterium]|jgi:Fe-S cluster assembly protein SufB